MSKSKTAEPVSAFGRATQHKGMNLAGMLRESGAATPSPPAKTPEPDPAPEPRREPAPAANQTPATAAATTAAEKAPAPLALPASVVPEVEPDVTATSTTQARVERAAGREKARPTRTPATAKPAKPVKQPAAEDDAAVPARKSVTAQVPAQVWEAWDELLSESRLPWRSDATAAAIRSMMELPDGQLLDAVLTEAAAERGLTRQLGARVDTELYAQFTGRLERLGRLPINAGLTAALRRATGSGASELRRRVLAERVPS